MNVKIDTKEKFTVITPEVSVLSANMTEELIDLLLSYLPKDIPHIILKMDNVIEMDELAAKKLSLIQQQFYEHNHSFVICQLQTDPEQVLKKLDLLELMNITPTESEAWDIVQMEEIERELMGDE